MFPPLMPSMIQSWRDDWQQGDFPFYMVQLANFRDIAPQPLIRRWLEGVKVPSSARLAVDIDPYSFL